MPTAEDLSAAAATLERTLTQLRIMSGEEWQVIGRERQRNANEPPAAGGTARPETPPPAFTVTVNDVAPATPTGQRTGSNYPAYAVFRGSRVGVTNRWPLVNSAANGSYRTRERWPAYKGYMSLEKACTIFKLAYNLGLVGEEGRPPPPIFWPEAYVGSFNDYEVPQLSEGEHGNGHYDVFDFIGQLPGLLNDLAFAKAETMFINPNERETEIVVIVKGRHPGVAGNRIAAQNAIGLSGKAQVLTFNNWADADHAFIRAYMTSQLVAYNDNGTIRAHICPYY